MWTSLLLASMAMAQEEPAPETPPDNTPGTITIELAQEPEAEAEGEPEAEPDGETEAEGETEPSAETPAPETPAPEPPTPPTEDGEDEEPPPPPLDTSGAEEIGGITEEQHDFLQPKRHRLEQNPYAQVDFTAYTLEWGEVKLGVTGVQMGVAPRVQLGTQPLFDLLGLYNGYAKANLLRVEGFDLGLIGQVVYVPLGDFKGSFIQAGSITTSDADSDDTTRGSTTFTDLRVWISSPT